MQLSNLIYVIFNQFTNFQIPKKSPTIMLANNKTESYFNFNSTAYPQPPKTRRSRERGGNFRGAQFSFKNSEPTPITSQIKPVEVIDYIHLSGQYYSSNSKVISGANKNCQYLTNITLISFFLYTSSCTMI
jgi:hypothetical protein